LQWFRSFLVWLFFEIFVASSAVVLVTHVIVPLYISTDVQQVKRRLLANVITYKNKLTTAGRRHNYQPDTTIPRNGDANTEEDSKPVFNAAKYLFVSSRLASLFPEYQESKVISEFSTPWPKQNFKQEKANLSNNYNRSTAFIQASLSRVVLFFLAGLINLPSAAQDTLVEMSSVLGLGAIAVQFVKLYNTSPLLLLVPLVAMGILIHFMVFSGKKDSRIQRLKELQSLTDLVKVEDVEPSMEPEDSLHLASPKKSASFAHNSEQKALAQGRKLSLQMYDSIQRDALRRQEEKEAVAANSHTLVIQELDGEEEEDDEEEEEEQESCSDAKQSSSDFASSDDEDEDEDQFDFTTRKNMPAHIFELSESSDSDNDTKKSSGGGGDDSDDYDEMNIIRLPERPSNVGSASDDSKVGISRAASKTVSPSLSVLVGSSDDEDVMSGPLKSKETDDDKARRMSRATMLLQKRAQIAQPSASSPLSAARASLLQRASSTATHSHTIAPSPYATVVRSESLPVGPAGAEEDDKARRISRASMLLQKRAEKIRKATDEK
jgi:hypothetical protein